MHNFVSFMTKFNALSSPLRKKIINPTQNIFTLFFLRTLCPVKLRKSFSFLFQEIIKNILRLIQKMSCPGGNYIEIKGKGTHVQYILKTFYQREREIQTPKKFKLDLLRCLKVDLFRCLNLKLSTRKTFLIHESLTFVLESDANCLNLSFSVLIILGKSLVLQLH